MTQHVLTDAEMHALICGYPSTIGLSIARLKDFIRQVEKAVVAKLVAEQEPVAWFIDDKRVCGNRIIIDLAIAKDWLETNPDKVTPLYARPMPCVSPASDKTACVSEIAESDTQKHVTEEYKRFCDWCDANPSFDLDSRLHTSGGTIDNGGYISDEKTRIAFAAWRAAKKALVAAPKYTGDSNE